MEHGKNYEKNQKRILKRKLKIKEAQASLQKKTKLVEPDDVLKKSNSPESDDEEGMSSEAFAKHERTLVKNQTKSIMAVSNLTGPEQEIIPMTEKEKLMFKIIDGLEEEIRNLKKNKC